MGGFLPHHDQHIAALQADKLFGKAKARAVHHVRRQANTAEQPGGVFGEDPRGADTEDPHLACVAEQCHRLSHRRAVVGPRQDLAHPLMAFKHKINTGVDVAGERGNRRAHLFRRGDRGAEPALHGLLKLAQPGEAQRLDGAHHRGVGGLGRGGDLHRRMLQHHLAVVVDIADHRPQPGGELVRPGAIAFAEQIDFALLFFYRAFHLASAGIGLPAICDCTWATIRDSAA